jgi:hypothetical protein
MMSRSILSTGQWTDDIDRDGMSDHFCLSSGPPDDEIKQALKHPDFYALAFEGSPHETEYLAR